MTCVMQSSKDTVLETQMTSPLPAPWSSDDFLTAAGDMWTRSPEALS